MDRVPHSENMFSQNRNQSQLGPWSNPPGMRPTGGRSEHAVSTRTACSHFARFARIRPQPPLACLAARSRFAARLACSARFARPSPLLACALASLDLEPAASPACFTHLTGCSLRSTRLSRCSLRSSSLLLPSLISLGPLLLAPLAASPAVLSLRSSARLLLAPLAASTAARFARRWLLRQLLASLAVYLLDLLARLTRLARFACSRGSSLTGRAAVWTGSICGIDVTEA